MNPGKGSCVQESKQCNQVGEAHRGMCSMAFLPKKLQGADEGLGAHLPAMHICPLVELEGQVPVALDPLSKHVVDHGL